MIMSMVRPYLDMARSLSKVGTRQQRMQSVVDALWSGLEATGVSWVGFYVHVSGEELILGPRQPKPACSPIGLHGACGQVYQSRRPLVVRNVRELGSNYIACDPRDQSEIVVPLLTDEGVCWGVLDLDSHAVGSFSGAAVTGLVTVLRAAGLSA